MNIQFCGAAKTVTGSCFLVTTKERKFLVDCGLFQGSKSLKELNYGPFPFTPSEIDFVLLTHAHIDHCGLIPKLYKHGFRGPIYTTKATIGLCKVVLPDSGYIQEMEVVRKNRKLARSGRPLLEPIYTAEDAQNCLGLFKSFPYETPFIAAPGIRVKFYDAGHILGSAMIEITLEKEGTEKRIVFTGDIGNTDTAIVEDPTKIKQADLVVMESTYGDRYHLETEDRLAALVRVVKETMAKGGNLVIPSFAVERTQDLVYCLKIMKGKKLIPPVDIYIDSPMAVEATKVFIQNPEFFDQEATLRIKGKGAEALFTGEDIHYVLSTEQSIALNKVRGGAIIISASGMADAGRIKHHLKHNLWRPESTVLFVGYQAQGTLGRRILDGQKKVRIHGEQIAVKANVERIDDFSAHADQSGLLEWLKGFQTIPRQIVLVHGESNALKTLQRVIDRELGVKAQIAEYGMIYDPATAAVVAEKRDYPFPLPVTTALEPCLQDAFTLIAENILLRSQAQGCEPKLMQRLLAQLAEIQRELQKVD
ncbi:MAG TPA: MBL fold metallo-hydrolase [Clostridia bacterium]|jgi:metallo-beta-lactamase family protein|nr:MBL fold metallo-hydrolase [Clostridia bacterium]